MFHANIDQYEFARNVINTGLNGWLDQARRRHSLQAPLVTSAVSYKRHFNFSLLFKQWAIHRIRAARIDELKRTRNLLLKQT